MITPKMIERKDIQRVVDAADVHEVLADFLPELKKKGANYVCCCPFHGERTPSFVVVRRAGAITASDAGRMATP